MVKNCSFFIRSLFLLLLCVVAQGCEKSDTFGGYDNGAVLERGDTAARTVLVYIMAENSLADNVASDLNEMRRGTVDIPDSCYLLAFVDDMNKPYICRFYENKMGDVVCDTVCKFQEDFYSTDSAEFKKVLSWVLQEFPSENLGLVMWSHGNGWLYDAQRNRCIGVDNGKNVYGDILSSSRWMEVEELAAVLKGLPVKSDFVLFDACFMQCVEVAYAMREAADWIIGSPAELPGNGAPYDRIMSSMFAFPFDAKELIERYKDGYPGISGVMLSAVNSSAVDRLAEVTAMFIPAYFSSDLQIDDSDVFSYLSGGYFSPIIQYPEYSDMNGQMMLRLSDEAYLMWKEAFDAAVPYRIASRKWWSSLNDSVYLVDESQFGGLSMYVPRDNSLYSAFNAYFRKSEWYQAAGWSGAGW